MVVVENIVRPLNPVRVSTIREWGPDNFDYSGVVFDHLGQQYRFCTNDDLTVGERYVVNIKRIDETTVMITDSWNYTGYR